MSNLNKFKIYSFYRFVSVNNKKKIKFEIEKFLKDKNIKGTILIADEGVNATVAGSKEILDLLIKCIKMLLKIRLISLKINKIDYLPFNKMKIRLKNEIVSLGYPNLIIGRSSGKYIHPKDWDKLTNKKKIKTIDTRNIYEIPIGRFVNTLNPLTKSFREFPNKFIDLKIDKNQEIALYCTGGIRCEKASAYLKTKGFKKIYQLEGGILNYLDYHKDKSKINNWRGECFVFDKRVSVNKNLNKGKYLQCYGCRRPITKKDLNSKNYQHGVHCHYCYFERSEEQKKRSNDRQKQIDLSK